MRILRVQYNGKKGFWTIVQKTLIGSGGWKKPNDIFCLCNSKEKAEEFLDQMIRDNPEHYKRED